MSEIDLEVHSWTNRKTANAVARFDNLEFLSDVVPRTVTYKEYKQKQSKQASGSSVANGQTTLDGKKMQLNEENEGEIDDGATEPDVEMEDAPEQDTKPESEPQQLDVRDHDRPMT